jgi:hypothetical protein
MDNDKISYADLWCGKSSHFRIAFQADEFNFEENNLEASTTGDAIKFISKVVNKRAPAHSIPIITLEVPAIDPVDIEDSCLPLVFINSIDIETGAGGNNFASGLHFDTYKRGVRTGGTPIGREQTQTSVSDKILNSNLIGEIPRNSSRRRSYEKIMPFNGYYDRTGFNMPVHMQPFPTEDGKFLPLGLNPITNEYTPVGSHIDPAKVYQQCENLFSENVYNGVPVSSTYPVRGW